MIVYAIRYFLAIGIHAASALVILVLVVAAGIWTAVLDPSELDSGLGMVLVVQMFLASSGFAPRARRGHFDALIARLRGRTAIALAHGIVSVAPGIAAWIALAAAGGLLGSPAAWPALAGARGAALLIVSAVAWSAGFLLTRGAAGLLWIVVLIGLLVGHVEVLGPAVAAPQSVATLAAHAVAVLACPFLLIGGRPPIAPVSIAAALCVASALVAWTVRLARGLDIYLVDHA